MHLYLITLIYEDKFTKIKFKINNNITNKISYIVHSKLYKISKDKI